MEAKYVLILIYMEYTIGVGKPERSAILRVCLTPYLHGIYYRSQ